MTHGRVGLKHLCCDQNLSQEAGSEGSFQSLQMIAGDCTTFYSILTLHYTIMQRTNRLKQAVRTVHAFRM